MKKHPFKPHHVQTHTQRTIRRRHLVHRCDIQQDTLKDTQIFAISQSTAIIQTKKCNLSVRYTGGSVGPVPEMLSEVEITRTHFSSVSLIKFLHTHSKIAEKKIVCLR